jgi:hypothetical protein
VLARWAVGTGTRISLPPLPLFWGSALYRPQASELSAGYEPATPIGQTGRSRPVPALQLRQVAPGSTAREARTVPQVKGADRELPLAEVQIVHAAPIQEEQHTPAIRHAVTPARQQPSSTTSSEDPVRVPPHPIVDSRRGEEVSRSDRQSHAANVLSPTPEASLLPQDSISEGREVSSSPLQPDRVKPSEKSRSGPELELAHYPRESQVTSGDTPSGGGISAAQESVSAIPAATRTAPGRSVTLGDYIAVSGIFRRATGWLKGYTARTFPAIHLLRQGSGISRAELASPSARSGMWPAEGSISLPLFRRHAVSPPWSTPGARHISALPSGPRTSSPVEIYWSVKAQEPQPPPGSPFTEPPQNDQGRIQTAGPVSSAADANRSGIITAQRAATRQSLTPVSRVGQTWPTLSRIGSGKGSIPFPLFRYPARSSSWGSAGARPFFALPSALPASARVETYRSANAQEAPVPGSRFPEPLLQSDKGTSKAPDRASYEADADRSITVKGVTPSPLPGPEFGLVETKPRDLSQMSSKGGWIPLPLFGPGAGSSAGSGHSAAGSPSIPPAPAAVSILRSTYPEAPRQGPLSRADGVQNSVESSPSEKPPDLPIVRAQPARPPGLSSQEYADRSRDPVFLETPGANRPLAIAGLTIGTVPTVRRSFDWARPSPQENPDRSMGRAAFLPGATIASSMLFPLTGAGITGHAAGLSRQPNAATDRALSTIMKSPIQPMLSSVRSRTVQDRQGGPGDDIRLPGAGHSDWLAATPATPLIAPASSVFAFPLGAAPRMPIVSRLAEPLRNSEFASPDAGRVVTTAAVESNQVTYDQPFPARLDSSAVPLADAPRAREAQPPVLHSTNLGSVTHIARSMLSFPFRRAAEVTALPWGKTGGSALVENQSSIVNRQSSIVNLQSSIVNRQSSIKMRTFLPFVATQDAGHSGRLDLHRIAPVRSFTAAGTGPSAPGPGGDVFVSRTSRIAGAPAGDAPSHPGELPLRYSSPELPLASAVQRRSETGRGGELSLAESPGAPGEPGRAVTIGENGLVTAPAPPAPPAAAVDIEEVFDRVVRRLVRELAIERERRGFTPWL